MKKFLTFASIVLVLGILWIISKGRKSMIEKVETNKQPKVSNSIQVEKLEIHVKQWVEEARGGVEPHNDQGNRITIPKELEIEVIISNGILENDCVDATQEVEFVK